MIRVSIDGKELTNVQSVSVSFNREHNGRGELYGKPHPLLVTIHRDCSLRGDAQIVPFKAATCNPKKIRLEINMSNAGHGDALNFEIDKAFVSTWKLENISSRAASESLYIYAAETKLSTGSNNASYKLNQFTIPE